MRLPRTIVYVDGFNFYHSAFVRGKHGGFKWLDMPAFCRLALPKNDVVLVRYFTARVLANGGRVRARRRQDQYLGALETLPSLSVHYGNFVERKKYLKLIRPKPGEKRVWVWVPEEKGSDVNLASYLLLDAFTRAYDVAVVLSNDADLREPIRMVREELGHPVGIMWVSGGGKKCVFGRDVDFVRPLRRWHFEQAQLPPTVTSPAGDVFKQPVPWARAAQRSTSTSRPDRAN